MKNFLDSKIYLVCLSIHEPISDIHFFKFDI